MISRASARRAWPAGLFAALLWLASGLLIAFIVLPIVRLAATSSPSSLISSASQAEVRDAIVLSLQDAAITAAIATLLGVPLAYLLAQRRVPAPDWCRPSSISRWRCRTLSPVSPCCFCWGAPAGSALLRGTSV